MYYIRHNESIEIEDKNEIKEINLAAIRCLPWLVVVVPRSVVSINEVRKLD